MLKRLTLAATVALLALWLSPEPVVAQSSDRTSASAENDSRVALGLGLGIVKPEDDSEIYFNASLRFRLGRDLDDEDDRRSYQRRQGDRGIRGYLEPEIGYWKQDLEGVEGTDAFETTDLLVGVNLLGVVPTRNAEYFIGVGFGVHFLDTTVRFSDTNTIDLDESETSLGANLQVGLDVNISRKLALFGVGRFDLVEDARDDTQLKVYGGLRFKF